MKKLMRAIIAALCAIMCFVAVGCDGNNSTDDGGEPHIHVYGEWQIKTEPKCNEAGVMVQSCTCGSEREQTISPKGHSYMSSVCSDCGSKLNETRGLTFIENGDGTCSVSGIGTCTDSEILIPEVYEGMTVTGVSDRAFSGNGTITVIIIPDTVISIGESAFADCTRLKTVSVGGGVRSIGAAAFSGCAELAVFVIGEGIEEIGERAFAECVSIKGIFLPETLSIIGTDAFLMCNNAVIRTSIDVLPQGWLLDGITVEQGHCHSFGEWISVREASCTVVGILNQYCDCGYRSISISALLDHKTEKIEAKEPSCAEYGLSEGEACTVCGTVTKEQTVIPMKAHDYVDGACTVCKGNKVNSTGLSFEIVGNYASLAGIGTCTDTEIVVPSSYNGKPVKYVNNNAFRGNKNIKMVYLPSGIESLGTGTFYECTALVTVVLPKNIKSIDSSVFSGCTSLTEISIPSKVISIGSVAFKNCISLRHLELAEGLKQIEANAFNGCKSLESLTIPNSVTLIGKGAFYGCTGLRIVNIGSDSSLDEIGEEAFFSCAKLEEITIPVSVKTFRSNAFMHCTALKRVNYAGDVRDWCSVTLEGTLSSPFGNGAPLCFNGQLITNLVIPADVTAVGKNAFACCSGVESLVVECASTALGDYAFSGIASLRSVSLPEGDVLLGNYLFSFCTALEELVIPEGTRTLSSGLLYGCTAVTKLTLPSSLERIEYGVLEGCSYSGTIVIPISVTYISDRAFIGCIAIKILCEAEQQPAGWDQNWNCDNIEVEWGYSAQS